jgi:uncharacterized protein (UPF0335 family)
MRTSMQELMDALNDLETVYLQNDWRREVIGINQAKNLIEHIYLEKEKEQIMDAYDEGWSDGFDDKDLNAEYYNETFNTKEIK